VIGSGFVATNLRPPSRAVRRTELFRRDLGAEPVWLTIDPEGRYAIIATERPCKLFQIWFDARERLDLLSDEASLPDLARVEATALGQHTTAGRLLTLYAPADSAHPALLHILFADRENAGVFTSPEVLTEAMWQEQGFAGEVWYRPTFQDWTTPEPRDE
jgi:hypothetical protein